MKTCQLLILAFLLAVSSGIFAQENIEKPVKASRAVYLELAGNGVIYSINYDKIFHQKGAFKSSYRVGISVYPRNYDRIYANVYLPLEITGMYGKRNGHFEFGLGVTPSYLNYGTFDPTNADREVLDYSGMGLAVFGRLGYRYQKPDGGFFFRIAVNPILADIMPQRDDKYFYGPYGGISFGKSF